MLKEEQLKYKEIALTKDLNSNNNDINNTRELIKGDRDKE
jgi:hypothetical protein